MPTIEDRNKQEYKEAREAFERALRLLDERTQELHDTLAAQIAAPTTWERLHFLPPGFDPLAPGEAMYQQAQLVLEGIKEGRNAILHQCTKDNVTLEKIRSLTRQLTHAEFTLSSTITIARNPLTVSPDQIATLQARAAELSPSFWQKYRSGVLGVLAIGVALTATVLTCGAAAAAMAVGYGIVKGGAIVAANSAASALAPGINAIAGIATATPGAATQAWVATPSTFANATTTLASWATTLKSAAANLMSMLSPSLQKVAASAATKFTGMNLYAQAGICAATGLLTFGAISGASKTAKSAHDYVERRRGLRYRDRQAAQGAASYSLAQTPQNLFALRDGETAADRLEKENAKSTVEEHEIQLLDSSDFSRNPQSQ